MRMKATVTLTRERRGRVFRYLVRVNGKIVNSVKDSAAHGQAAKESAMLVLTAAGVEVGPTDE